MSASSVARICNEERKDKRSVGVKNKRGWPRKPDERIVRKLIRCITNARKTNPNMTVRTQVSESALSLELADRRTFSLNENGYGFFQGSRQNVNWGGVYSDIHVLPGRFLFKLIDLNLI